QIHTKSRTGVTVRGSAGNYGSLSGYASAGISEEYFDLSASAAHDSNDGYGKKDVTGHKDDFTSNTQNARLKLKPSDSLSFSLEATSSRIDTRYVNPLSIAQFKADPRQVGLNALGLPELTHQGLDTDQWRLGAEYAINNNWKLAANHYQEDKTSDYINFDNRLDYDYRSNDLSLSYEDERFSSILGVQNFEGTRNATNNSTSKDNVAAFLQGEYRIADWTFSAGARREKIDYEYNPDAGSLQNASEKLDAWDVGLNYRFTEEASLFANYNRAYQAPDIDRFFLFGGGFNGFIKPEKSKTFNLGLNNVTAVNRLKITAFYVDLNNEIYFNPLTFANTNLDQTHKYGVEIQDRWDITDQLSSSIIYTYTRAKIDHEADGAGSFDCKDLPGVPKNSINASLNYRPIKPININLSHTWRSSSYVIGDFANSLNEKQDDYHSTNMAVTYQWHEFQWFAAVSNLFEHKNGLFVRSDFPVANDVVVYPSDFKRTWRIGVKVDL
ncbi:MAG TPA: TonB-dependent receptor, partial [Methylophilaceae bacterium]|nr:TonB-dependent receptor [Methylophilaceae bacterium]